MFTLRALVVALVSLGIALPVLANEPTPPKKPNPPKQNPNPNPNPNQNQQQQQRQQQQMQQLQQLRELQQLAAIQQLRELRLLSLQAIMSRMMVSRYQMPVVPMFAPGYAFLPNYMTNMNRYPQGTPPPPPSMGGPSRELVLDLSSTTTFSQLRPGSATQYQPATSDALKVGQTINVLAKNDPAVTDKTGTWSFPAQITAIDDGDPKKLTVMAQLNPAQGEFNPADKIITAVSIKAAPALAQNKAAN